MTQPKFNLSVADAIAEMRTVYEQMKAEENREQLSDMNPDDAFEMGYLVAINDFESLTGPNPTENKK